MNRKKINSIKLGLFVIAGLAFLILTLYMIGKNENLFGSKIELRATFRNVSGLVQGNNVRYAGIEVGTVKNIRIISDTSIEVVMSVYEEMKDIIRKNAIVSIGSDGLMGNKVINIVPSEPGSDFVKEHDLLPTHSAIDMDDMLQVLNRTNNNIAAISGQLRLTVSRINENNEFWKLLGEPGLADDVRASLRNIHKASMNANDLTADLRSVIADVKNGEGAAGLILRDSAFAGNIEQAVFKIQHVADAADTLANEIDRISRSLHSDIESGEGLVHTLLKDTSLVLKLDRSIENIEKGTDSFNQNMEALKHNFLFRPYFRKLEKQQNKEKLSSPH